MTNKEAIKRVTIIKTYGGMTIPLAMRDIEALDMAIKALEEQERPTGEWIRYRDNPHQPEHIKCSICGQYWSIADHDKTFEYCFKCGAEMKEAENEDQETT